MIKILGYALGLAIATPLFFIIGILSILWQSWWLYPFWDWYMVPLGLRHISFYHFSAILLIIGHLTFKPNTKKDDRETSWVSVSVSLFSPILVWAILLWLRGAV